MVKIYSQGIVVAKHNFNDNSFLCSLITKDLGLFKTLVKANKKQITYAQKNSVQPSSVVEMHYYARNENSLGTAKMNCIENYMHFFLESKIKLSCFNLLTTIIINVCIEREPVTELYNYIYKFLTKYSKIDDVKQWMIYYSMLEYKILMTIGFLPDMTTLDDTQNYFLSEELNIISEKNINLHDKYTQTNQKLVKFPQYIINIYNHQNCITTTNDKQNKLLQIRDDIEQEITMENIIDSLRITYFCLNKFLKKHNKEYKISHIVIAYQNLVNQLKKIS